MCEQERQIISLLLNEMAFEGALKHFLEDLPEISKEIFDEIEEIGLPQRYNRATENYEHAALTFNANKSVFENCYGCLRMIRNNIIHANKAFRPDTPERLADLLAWTEHFIDSVYSTEGAFSARAIEIKSILKIESF